MHRACVRTALINEISTVTAPEVVLEVLLWCGVGPLWAPVLCSCCPLAVRDVAIQSRRSGASLDT